MISQPLYPLIMLTALLIGGWILRRSQQSLALPKEQRLAIGLGAFCGAMLGAKLPFAFSDWNGLLDGSVWFSNGKTIMSGLVGAYVSVELVKWIVGVRVKTGDSFVVAAAVTIGIGRLGCLAAGCCYGLPSELPWAMRCAIVDNLRRHPTQLYESMFHFSIAWLMFELQRRKIWRGQLAKFYLLSYFAYRFFSEELRPEATLAFGLTAYQWFALLCAPVFIILWWVDSKHFEQTENGKPQTAPALMDR